MVCGFTASFASAEELVQDLGTSEVVDSPDYLRANDVSYTEISSSAWEGKALSAADLLSTLPGIQAYKQGGLGSFQSVSIRGIAARNIMICVDGVPLNDASGGAVNLAAIDLNQMEKVTICTIRITAGGSGSLFLSNSLILFDPAVLLIRGT